MVGLLNFLFLKNQLIFTLMPFFFLIEYELILPQSEQLISTAAFLLVWFAAIGIVTEMMSPINFLDIVGTWIMLCLFNLCFYTIL